MRGTSLRILVSCGRLGRCALALLLVSSGALVNISCQRQGRSDDRSRSTGGGLSSMLVAELSLADMEGAFVSACGGVGDGQLAVEAHQIPGSAQRGSKLLVFDREGRTAGTFESRGPTLSGPQAQWAPDGSAILFWVVRRGSAGWSSAMALARPADSSITSVATGVSDSACGRIQQPWSPDGTRVLLAVRSSKLAPAGTGVLAIVGRHGGKVEPLGVAHWDSAAWSQDGRSVLFARQGDLFRLDLDSGDRAAHRVGVIAWPPGASDQFWECLAVDGAAGARVVFGEGGDESLWVFHRERASSRHSPARRIENGADELGLPQCSRDGRFVAYHLHRGGAEEHAVRVYDLHSGRKREFRVPWPVSRVAFTGSREIAFVALPPGGKAQLRVAVW